MVEEYKKRRAKTSEELRSIKYRRMRQLKLRITVEYKMRKECKLVEKNKYKQEMRLPIIVAANQLLHATKAKIKAD